MYINEYSMQERISKFMYGVYGLMALALAITAGTAYYVAATPAFYATLFSSPGLLIGMFIGQLVLVLVLSFFIMRLSVPVALGLFCIYAVSLGITLSSVFLVYTAMSIYQTFLVTAGMFGVMCLYGYFTRTDLTAIGNIALMALIGLIIGLLVNWYFASEVADLMLSGLGVIIFTLLTAYDTQKIKLLAQQLSVDEQTMSKIAVLGALTLYLDFINLFLFMLRFMGRRRE